MYTYMFIWFLHDLPVTACYKHMIVVFMFCTWKRSQRSSHLAPTTADLSRTFRGNISGSQGTSNAFQFCLTTLKVWSASVQCPHSQIYIDLCIEYIAHTLYIEKSWKISHSSTYFYQVQQISGGDPFVFCNSPPSGAPVHRGSKSGQRHRSVRRVERQFGPWTTYFICRQAIPVHQAVCFHLDVWFGFVKYHHLHLCPFPICALVLVVIVILAPTGVLLKYRGQHSKQHSRSCRVREPFLSDIWMR